MHGKSSDKYKKLCNHTTEKGRLSLSLGNDVYLGIVIFIRAAAKVGRRLHRIASRNGISELPIAILEACGNVHAAADGLRRIDCGNPIRKIPTGGGVCGCGRNGGRCCAGPAGRIGGIGFGFAGRIGGIGFGFAGVEVCGEEGVVVVASDVQGGEDLFYDCCAEGVAFVRRAVVVEGEGDV